MEKPGKDKNKVFKIRDIAEMAGVSTATVSRVLNNSDKVTKKTRKKVLQIIESVDYVPSEMARALVKKSNKVIGMLIPDMLNGYYSELTTYVEPLLSDRGYSLQLCITNGEPDKDVYYIEDMIRRRVAGVIILSSEIKSSDLIRKMKNSMAVVSVEGNIAGVDQVCVENKQGIYQSVENLIQNGHYKIAFIGYQFERKGLEERLKGYKQALVDNGIAVRDEYILEDKFKKNLGYDAAVKLLELKDRPTAVQCMNEYCAQGVYMAFMEKGVRIPADISVSAFDGLENTKLWVPRLTTSALPIKTMASEAVNLVLNDIEHGNPEIPRMVILPTKLIQGNSIKDIRDILQ